MTNPIELELLKTLSKTYSQIMTSVKDITILGSPYCIVTVTVLFPQNSVTILFLCKYHGNRLSHMTSSYVTDTKDQQSIEIDKLSLYYALKKMKNVLPFYLDKKKLVDDKDRMKVFAEFVS